MRIFLHADALLSSLPSLLPLPSSLPLNTHQKIQATVLVKFQLHEGGGRKLTERMTTWGRDTVRGEAGDRVLRCKDVGQVMVGPLSSRSDAQVILILLGTLEQ